MLFALSILACSQNFVIASDEKDGTDLDTSDTAGGDDTAADTTAQWDGATLVVESPHSGDFLPYGESSAFQAVVYDADGNATDFSDITWTSDIDAAWHPSGASFDDDTLDVGTHALSATAVLPNGDRLVYSVGGVLVQSAYTGVYVGDLAVDVSGDYNGQTYAAGCSGALTLVVDAYGQTATGDAGCLLSLFGYDLDTTYAIDLDNADGELDGSSTADLVLVNYDFDTTGSITEDGAIEGTFSDDVYGYLQIDGTFTAERFSRDISDY